MRIYSTASADDRFVVGIQGCLRIDAVGELAVIDGGCDRRVGSERGIRRYAAKALAEHVERIVRITGDGRLINRMQVAVVDIAIGGKTRVRVMDPRKSAESLRKK